MKTSAIMAVTALAGGLAAVQADVVAHYSFDTDYSDSSGNGWDGTMVDNGTVGNSGITTAEYKFGGGALSLATDDTDYISLAEHSFAAGEAYSMSAWVKRADRTDDWDMILGEYGTRGNFIAVGGDSEQVRGLRLRGSDTTNVNDVDAAGGYDEQWHHYAVSVTAENTATVYIDGAVVATDNSTPHVGFVYDAIGSAYLQDDRYTNFSFNGEMDEVWIMDEAIDQAAVTSLYQQNVIPEPVTLGLVIFVGIGMTAVRRIFMK